MTMSDPSVAPSPAQPESRFALLDEIKAPATRDPISRKLVAGTGLGGAFAVLLASLIHGVFGYQLSIEEAGAVQTVLGALVGWWVKEDLGAGA